MFPRLLVVPSCVFLVCAASAMSADAPPKPAPATAPAACSGPAFAPGARLAGDWDAVVGERIIGRDVLTSRLQGCAIEEQWTGARGMHGTSLTAFDAAAKRWRQFWVDDSGTVAALEGAFDGDALVLDGDSNQAGGNSKHVRGTWRPVGCVEPQGACSIHVLWESQDAQTKAWTTMYEFDLQQHR